MKSIGETPRDIEYIAELLNISNHAAEQVIEEADAAIDEDFEAVPLEIQKKICSSAVFEYMKDHYAQAVFDKSEWAAYLDV